MTADADLKAYQQRREAAYKAVKRKERAEQLQDQAESIGPKRRRKGPRPMGRIGGWSGYGGEARVLHRQDKAPLKFP